MGILGYVCSQFPKTSVGIIYVPFYAIPSSQVTVNESSISYFINISFIGDKSNTCFECDWYDNRRLL